MTELDAELAAKLRTMGFSETEVARVLDTKIPAEQRDAEIKDILAREFIKQANDPSSGVMDEVIRRVEAELVPPPPRKRRWPIAVVALGVAAAIAIDVVATRKPAVNPCVVELGPIDRFGALAMVWLEDAHGKTELSLRNSIGSDFAMMKQIIEERRYASHETFRVGHHTVDFYVAGAARWSQQQLQDDIMQRVGRSHDPTGDALQAMPPAEHVALISHAGIVTELQLDGDVFPVTRAKELVTAIVRDWP